MPKRANSSHCSCTAVSRWEDAGELLADTLSSYLKSCISLETSSLDNSANAKATASRIDTSLNSLHKRLSREFAQSRVSLAKTRNKIISPFYSLPNEILAEIFLDVVYVPSPHDRLHLSMTQTLKNMYARLHSVLSVCTVWRNAGIKVRQLWSVIPMGGGRSKCPSQSATALSLERSGAIPSRDRGIHLAVLLSLRNDSYLPTVQGRIPQFRTLNVQSEYSYSIGKFFDNLLDRGLLRNLSELSIYQPCEERGDRNAHPQLPRNGDEITYLMRTRDLFTSLLGTLPVLRVRGIGIGWDKINFSNRLVELRLQSLVLGPDSKLVGLLQALKSASELRDLKLISIVTFPDSTISWNLLSRRFSFPKLETFLLQDPNFTALKLLLRAIAPGSHRLRLFLTKTCKQIHLPGEEPEEPDVEDIYALLRRVVVDVLILKGDGLDDSWLDSSELHGLLKSLPTLRTLKITHWDLPENNLLALKRFRDGRKGPSQSFPNFNELHLVDVQLWETDLKALKQLVFSHSLQKMELSGIYIKGVPVDQETDSESEEWEEFTEDFRLVKWLKKTVPQFRLARNIHETEDHDFQQDVWRLW